MRALVLTCPVILAVSWALAAAPTTLINPKTCTPIPAPFNGAGARAIGVNWVHYRPFMRLCPVKDSSGHTVLNILALDVPAAQNAGSLEWVDGKKWTPDSTRDSDPVPLPIVFDRAQRQLARLPKNVFPLLPNPGEIRFSQWQHDFPHEITVSTTFPNLGPRSPIECLPPFIWSSAKHRYIAPASQIYGICPKSRPSPQ